MSAGGVFNSAVDLGDKLHKNFNSQAKIFGELKLGGENLDEEKRQFDKSFSLEQMDAFLNAEGKRRQLNDQKRLRNAWLGR